MLQRRGAWWELGVPARPGQVLSRRPYGKRQAGKAGSGCERVPGLRGFGLQEDEQSEARMGEADGERGSQRDTGLSVLCYAHVAVMNVVEVLRSLVALTDSQEGKLTQSQEKALKLLGVWKTIFTAVRGPTSRTSVE